MIENIPVDRHFLAMVVRAARTMVAMNSRRLIEIGTAESALARRLIARRDPDGVIYVHEWLRSDPAELHDHPWDFCSVILETGYWEITPEGRFWREPGSIAFRKAEDRHRVEIDPTRPQPLSVIFTGPVRRQWGFHTARGFVRGDEYREGSQQ
ncbi:MAG: hypothetical protein ACREEN_08000 [Stellaceae bacterium]